MCATATTPHTAACSALKLVNDKGVVPAATTPPSTGLTPTGLRDAYKLNGLSASGRTVAIVDAYGYPNLERDLGVYRSQFGLSACTIANGCLRIINQTGGSTLPRFNVGWAGEQALDVDAVSAAAPDAKIVVVQANSASFADLGTAVVTAAKQAWRGGDLEQLRRRRRRRLDVRDLLQPPGDRCHRFDRRRRLPGRQLPGFVVLRHRRRRHLACCRQQHPRLVRVRLERRRFRLLDSTTPH